MTPIEVLATIFAVLVLLKLFLSIFNPQLRVRIAESFLNKNPTVLTVIFLALAAVIGYYVFSSLTVVDVAAVMMLLSALMGIFFIQYPENMLELVRESLKSRKEFLRKNWLSVLIWGFLAIWVIYSIFF